MNTLINRYAFAVWLRNFLTWQKMVWSSLASNVVNPVIFLFAFGFGLGSVIETMAGVPYLAFIVPGMMAYGAMFSSSFEATVSAYARFQMQRTWDAMLSTPLTLSELLVGELVWSACKGMLSCTAVLVVAAIWGGVSSIAGGLLALPVLMLASLAFAGCGLAATAFARNWEFFSYFFTFWITPMFMFSGVFFEIGRFPDFIQVFAWILPMTHLVEVIRPLMIGLALQPLDVMIHLGYLAAVTVVSFIVALHRLRRRLFD
ncbi:MAG: ABC transporter permease [Geminicoccaceae bacterium]|nr:ABC transporter permease [Geminicoccaceae bacterium]